MKKTSSTDGKSRSAAKAAAADTRPAVDVRVIRAGAASGGSYEWNRHAGEGLNQRFAAGHACE